MNNTIDPDTDPRLEVVNRIMNGLGDMDFTDADLHDALLTGYDAGYKQAFSDIKGTGRKIDEMGDAGWLDNAKAESPK